MKKHLCTTGILLLVGIVSCNLPTGADGSNQQKLGSIEIAVEDSLSASTITPELDMTIASYDITLSGSGNTVSQTVTATENTALFDDLEPGDWTISVNAKNADAPAVIIATGTAHSTVIAEQTSSASVIVTPVEGQGTLNVDIDWSDGIVTTPTIQAALTPTGGSQTDLSSYFVIDTAGMPDSGSYSGSWDAGYYTLSLGLYDGQTRVWGRQVAVRILAGEVSLGSYSLTESDINRVLVPAGSIELNIGSDLQNPFDITFSGVRSSISSQESMSALANLSPATTADSFEWYINGDLQSGVTGDTITLGPAGITLEEGTHWIDTVVSASDVRASEGFAVSVIDSSNLQNTEITMTITDGTVEHTLQGVLPVDVMSDTEIWGRFVGEEVIYSNVEPNTNFIVSIALSEGLVIPDPRPTTFSIEILDTAGGNHSFIDVPSSSLNVTGSLQGLGTQWEWIKNYYNTGTYGTQALFTSTEYGPGQVIDELVYQFEIPSDLPIGTLYLANDFRWKMMFDGDASNIEVGYQRQQ